MRVSLDDLGPNKYIVGHRSVGGYGTLRAGIRYMTYPTDREPLRQVIADYILNIATWVISIRHPDPAGQPVAWQYRYRSHYSGAADLGTDDVVSITFPTRIGKVVG